jgi:hypothetical protein
MSLLHEYCNKLSRLACMSRQYRQQLLLFGVIDLLQNNKVDLYIIFHHPRHQISHRVTLVSLGALCTLAEA